MKILSIALISAILVAAAPAEAARICRNSHDRDFHCHRVLAPRINFHKKHPIKILRCRGHHGRFNNC